MLDQYVTGNFPTVERLALARLTAPLVDYFRDCPPFLALLMARGGARKPADATASASLLLPSAWPSNSLAGRRFLPLFTRNLKQHFTLPRNPLPAFFEVAGDRGLDLAAGIGQLWLHPLLLSSDEAFRRLPSRCHGYQIMVLRRARNRNCEAVLCSSVS